MTILESMIDVYKKNNNQWFDYGELYEQLDPSLFGENKNGVQGKKNIVYRLIIGNKELFDVDENFRPKKFRLKTFDGTINDEYIQNQVKYSFGDSKLFLNNKEFKIVQYSVESQLEDDVKNNYKLIFGDNSIYFDLKKITKECNMDGFCMGCFDLKKKLGNRICDGFVFDKDLQKFIIVENELCIHDLWEHIIPQIIDFFNAIQNDNVKMKLKYEIDWKLSDSERLLMTKAIDMMNFDIVVVIDKITFDIAEQSSAISKLCSHFSGNKKININFKEFKTFVNDDNEKIFIVT